MSTVRMPVPSLRRLARLAAPPLTDADLLARFVATRDDSAFAELVRRHGPTVLAVCRRVTGNRDDADDAFQSTFLVLARKADRVRPGAAVGGWLYGVAVRAARAALTRTARRRARETAVATVPEVPDRSIAGPDPETTRAVLEAVAGLSDAYRTAVVLCELEGRPRAVAARELGIPEGTLSSRLGAARRILATRLRDRELATLAAVAGAVACPALAADADRLARTSAVPSPTVESLAEAVMRTVDVKRTLAAVAVALTVVGLAAGGGPIPEPAPESAPAPKPARAVDPSRLLIGVGGEIRYLTRDGKEIARLTGDEAKKAGADIMTRAVAIGIGTTGLMADAYPIFPVRGRAAPDGRLPVDTWKGLFLLSAGPPVLVRPITAAGGSKALFDGEGVPALVAWSGDGRHAVACWSDASLVGATRYTHALVDVGAGTTTELVLPDGHRVVDWSADGKWFLTTREDEPASLRNGLTARLSLCRVSRDGTEVKELVPAAEGPAHAAFAPTGTRVAYQRRVTAPAGGSAGLQEVGGFEIVLLDPATGVKRVVAAERGGATGGTAWSATPFGVRWSPDGTELAFAYLHRRHGRAVAAGWRVGVCGADGAGSRTVFAPAKTETSRVMNGFFLLDWR